MWKPIHTQTMWPHFLFHQITGGSRWRSSWGKRDKTKGKKPAVTWPPAYLTPLNPNKKSVCSQQLHPQWQTRRRSLTWSPAATSLWCPESWRLDVDVDVGRRSVDAAAASPDVPEMSLNLCAALLHSSLLSPHHYSGDTHTHTQPWLGDF